MDQQQIFVQIALNAWDIQISRIDKFISKFSDEELERQVAPGKNSIKYLLGHLIAVNDGMIGLYGLGNRSYAHLDEAFVKNPDRKGFAMPSAAEFRTEWKKSNEQLSKYFKNMTPADWLSKHSAMTDEDLAKDPARNKLSVLLNRTNHVAYHLGQLMLIDSPTA